MVYSSVDWWTVVDRGENRDENRDENREIFSFETDRQMDRWADQLQVQGLHS